MRKIGLMLSLTLGMLLAFASVAMAAPAIHFDSPSNQTIHGSYTKTSDACASCHSAHNALNGDANLLKFEDVSSACMACHDGTIATTYNVVEGTHDGMPNSGGLFGTSATNKTNTPGFSKHSVDGMNVAYAPGGPGKASDPDKNGDWGGELNCVACHDPHGTTGNARALNPNVNGIAKSQLKTDEVLSTTDNLTFQASRGTWMSGHGWDITIKVGGTKVTTGFTIDYVKGQVKFDQVQNSTVTATYYPGVEVKMDVQNPMTADESVKYISGMNQFCGACHTDYNNWGKTQGTNGIGGAYDELLGDYHPAYRHSVGFTRTPTAADPNFDDPDSLVSSYPGLVFEKSNVRSGKLAPTVNCVTCHYAHGTSDAFIKDTLEKQLGENNVFSGDNEFGDEIIKTYDNSRSSVLKRLPNMGVCQACHNKK